MGSGTYRWNGEYGWGWGWQIWMGAEVIDIDGAGVVAMDKCGWYCWGWGIWHIFPNWDRFKGR